MRFIIVLAAKQIAMSQITDVNNKSEHDLYLTLFASSSGGL